VKVGPVAIPPGVVTVTGPELLSEGTVAVIDVFDTTLKVVVTPLNFTAVAPVKFAPVIVIVSPVRPDVSESAVTVGGS